AAIDQLEIWGSRVGVEVIKQQEGTDPAAVAYDAVQAAKSRKVDVLIVDTAGRLHNKANLMEELRKITRVIGRELAGAPHEVLLVLDATTGQNALSQAKLFSEVAGVTGIALTKLDGTARGGVIIGIMHELSVPVKLIGIGEGLEDLREFAAGDFAAALFESR
ncbi:MAG: signaling recognition particle receptor family protein, partial [Peptococcaceae bacterium]|nr:signaling recognition particle receptor family protein [Peptococcaceae bacterium]